MAAAVQGQIRNIEGKLKPFLREGPFDQQWGFIEKKTTVRREQVALGRVSF